MGYLYSLIVPARRERRVEEIDQETYATRVLIDEHGKQRVLQVEAFADEREDLVKRLWMQLDESLDPVLRDMVRNSIRLDLLFPLGEVATLVGITRAPNGYRVRIEADGSQTSMDTRQLGWRYARFWRE